MAMNATCGGCDARWRRQGFAHCAAAGCHQTFSGVRTFDAHRRRFKCRKPADAGLVLGDDGVWRSPGTFDRKAWELGKDLKRVAEGK